MTRQAGSAMRTFVVLLALGVVFASEEETDKECGDDEICLTIEECPSFMEKLDRYKRLLRGSVKSNLLRELRDGVCNKREKAVCCPESEPAGGQFDSSGCNCGVRKEDLYYVRIFGGEEASVNEFPWAALLVIRRGNLVVRCGGTLINDKFVLTAAHCVPKSTGIDVDVILGDHNIREKSESTELRIRAEPPFLVHKEYKLSQRKGFVIYDFSLLKLSESVNFNLYPHIRPICLPDRRFTDYQDDQATVAGWGNTQVTPNIFGNLIQKKDDISLSDTLQKVDIRLYRQKKCKDIFEKMTDQGFPVQIMNMNMCAASQVGDACGGDSGGGLVKKTSREGFYEIVGVVSFGIGCGSSFEGETLPGVYARVSSVLGWIERETSSGKFCKKPTLTETATERKPVQ